MEDNLETAQNIYHSLTDGVIKIDSSTHRIAKMLSTLCQHLLDQGVISREALDAMLDEALH